MKAHIVRCMLPCTSISAGSGSAFEKQSTRSDGSDPMPFFGDDLVRTVLNLEGDDSSKERYYMKSLHPYGERQHIFDGRPFPSDWPYSGDTGYII